MLYETPLVRQSSAINECFHSPGNFGEQNQGAGWPGEEASGGGGATA